LEEEASAVGAGGGVGGPSRQCRRRPEEDVIDVAGGGDRWCRRGSGGDGEKVRKGKRTHAGFLYIVMRIYMQLGISGQPVI
jgi:hypothetical protein